MQDDSFLKSVLTIPWAYELFQNILGARGGKRWLAKKYWRLNGKEKVVDIGCGPGSILDYLPKDIEYVGFDISESCIREARRRFGERGLFIVGAARDFLPEADIRLCDADLVMCNGVLHHLDDSEVIEVLELSKRILKPNGRLVCIEPTFLILQGWFSKWLISRDRGRNVRYEQQWKEIISKVFDFFSTNIVTGLIRIPYIHIIIECLKKPE